MTVKTDEAAPIDEEALLAEFEAEKPARRLTGHPAARRPGGRASRSSLFALYWVFNPMAKQFYLPLFLSLGLFLTFLIYRGWGRSDRAKDEGSRTTPACARLGARAALAGAARLHRHRLAELLPARSPADRSRHRHGPDRSSCWCSRRPGARSGCSCRWWWSASWRTAYFGADHARARSRRRTSSWPRLIGHNVMGTQGVFGVPLDVAATYIILFTIYGAVLGRLGRDASSSSTCPSPHSGSHRPGPAAP